MGDHLQSGAVITKFHWPRRRVLLSAIGYLVAAAVCTGPVSASEEPLDTVLMGIAAALEKEASRRGITRIAVMDFEGSSETMTRFITDQLSLALAKQRLIVVDYKVLLKSLGRATGPNDPIPPELKRHVDGLVGGLITELSETVRVTARLLAVDSARLLASTHAVLPKKGIVQELARSAPESLRPEMPNTIPQQGSTEGMALIPAGPFVYGDGAVRREIHLPAYWIDFLEVTKAEYGSIRHYPYEEDKAQHPATNISWNEAVFFCQVKGKRLPTEIEWEKAARGTDGRRYPWGNEFDPKLVNGGNSQDGTTPVGQFPGGRSPYGLQDLAGNVAEWTSSSEDEVKIFRGGSWASSPDDLQVTYRDRLGPDYQLFHLGFRCARDVSQ